MKISTLIYSFAFLFVVSNVSAQEPKKDEKKIQEVVALDADRESLPPLPDGSIPADTSAPKPLASSEILKRAVNWVKLENTKFVKTVGVTTSNKAECVITFKYKPKELNPASDVQGTFTMHVSIEAKEGKYRYTISKINHNATNTEFSGGEVSEVVPKCGSMKLQADLWKRIKSEAYRNTAILVEDLKEGMKISSTTPVNNDEW